MKRYALFGAQDYEAMGGWNEFLSSHESIDGAKERASLDLVTDKHIDRFQIVDLRADIETSALILGGTVCKHRNIHWEKP